MSFALGLLTAVIFVDGVAEQSVLGADEAAKGGSAHTYYVDVDSRGGPCSDTNPGTVQRPWQSAIKAFKEARPGDTVVFRGGVYRLPRGVHISDFQPAPRGAAPIVFRGHVGEEAVVTVLRPVAADQWERHTDKNGKVFFSAPASRGRRVTNVVQNGIPLKRAFCGDRRQTLEDTPPEALDEPGQWASSLREGPRLPAHCQRCASAGQH